MGTVRGTATGLAMMLVATPVAVEATSYRYQRALHEIESYSLALEYYRDDFGSYPSQDEGLNALLPQPESKDENRIKGYVKAVGKDPWGFNYRYRFPGVHNSEGFDLWSSGADGRVGGAGSNTDCGNWEESARRCAKEHKPPTPVEEYAFYAAGAAVTGGVFGLPIYLAGVMLRRRSERSMFKGFHFGAFLYLVLVGPLIVCGVAVMSGFSS